MTDDPPLPVAVCAPGHRTAAMITLAGRLQPVREIREHPWLEGYDGILLFSEPDENRWADALRAHLGPAVPFEPVPPESVDRPCDDNDKPANG